MSNDSTPDAAEQAGSNSAAEQAQQTNTPATDSGRGGILKSLAMGTGAAVVAGGLMFQVLRAEPGVAQTRQPAAQQQSTSQKALARVNGQPVPYDIVAQECVARFGEEVLDNIINRMIIEQECQRRGVSISAQEIQAEVAKQAKKFNLPVESWYQMLQAERKLTPQQYQKDVVWPMLALKKLAGTEVTVSENDMRRAFERDYGPRVKARMILLDGNSRQASQVWEQCQADPSQFEKLAREHSADPNTRPLGGTVPPIRKNGGAPQIEEAAFALADGEVSAMIQIPGGQYVILKSEGRTEPVVTDIQDVWEELYSVLQEEKVQEAVAGIFEEVKSNAEVINHLTGEAVASVRKPGAIQQTGGTR